MEEKLTFSGSFMVKQFAQKWGENGEEMGKKVSNN